MAIQPLENYILGVQAEFDRIPPDRSSVLDQLAAYIQNRLNQSGKADVVCICTHNSRRSHLAQVWAQVAAYHYGIKNINAYSGGTEVSALNPMATHALEKAGFAVQKLSTGINPVYAIKYHPDEPALIGFSKTYDDPFNVQNGFIAVMTCSHADENCPFIPTAAQRISLSYDDPKDYDGTPHQEEKYAERCRDIAREMLYVFTKMIKS